MNSAEQLFLNPNQRYRLLRAALLKFLPIALFCFVYSLNLVHASEVTSKSTQARDLVEQNFGILSYRNYGVLANPGLMFGSASGGQNYGYESVAGIKDPMTDPRLAPQKLSFLSLPRQFVSGFTSQKKLDVQAVAFSRGEIVHLPVLPSSVVAIQSIQDVLTDLIPVRIEPEIHDVHALRLESRSHIFQQSDGQPLSFSAKSTGSYENMIGPGNPDDYKPFPPSLAIWGVLTSDFFEARMRERPSDYQIQTPVMLLPDRAAYWINTEVIPGFREIPFQQIQRTKLVKNTAWSFRDLSELRQENIYVTEFSASHKTIGKAIALANGFDSPIDFWIESAVKPLARALTQTLLFTGAETFSLHGQNKTFEFDSWLRPTERVFLKDASDFIFREATSKSLNIPYPDVFRVHQQQFPEMHADMQDKLIDASFYNAQFGYNASKSTELQSRYALISTTFENRGAFDWLFGPNEAKLRSAFLNEVVNEISLITGISTEKIEKIASVKSIQGYFNIIFDTQTETWIEITSRLQSPRPFKRPANRWLRPTQVEKDAVALMARFAKARGSEIRKAQMEFDQLIQADADSVVRAIALHVAQFRPISLAMSEFLLLRLASRISMDRIERLAELVMSEGPKRNALLERISKMSHQKASQCLSLFGG